MWDAIVIGSGIGGLAAAAALSKNKRRVLVLEQHSVAGGLTQTFRRKDWTFAPGVHYIGGVGPHPGPEGQFGRVLSWLTEGALSFEPCANPYDIVRLPGFEFGIAHPESAYREALLARFPQQEASIAGWFAACEAARKSALTLLELHSLPAWMSWGLRLWRGGEVEHWARHTLADELAKIGDPRLAAVLGARWADYGAPPDQAPFVVHALVTGFYSAGSYYPVGGPSRFAQTLVPVIESGGGEVRLGADVKHIGTDDGRASQVEFEHGGQRRREQARHVISAIGVANTVACLDANTATRWQEAIRAMTPGMAYLSLFLGLEGDLAAAGAGSANHWIYESDDIGAAGRRPADEDAPGIFVSFPSLKDPTSPGEPTAEVITVVDPQAFAPWLALPDHERPKEYQAFKARIEERMLAQFLRHFPALRPMLRFHELSTPVTQQHYVRWPEGSMYGVEMTAQRVTSPALQVRTPLPGLVLAGQDIAWPGVPGAFMGGLMAAAAVEPGLWSRLPQ